MPSLNLAKAQEKFCSKYKFKSTKSRKENIHSIEISSEDINFDLKSRLKRFLPFLTLLKTDGIIIDLKNAHIDEYI